MTPLFRRLLSCFAAAGAASLAVPAMADGIREDPIARYAEPLCPGVAGLRAEMGMAVANRIRANAGELGMRLGEEGCEPNMVVVFLEDGQSYLEALVEERKALFRSLSAAERRELLGQQGPARAWIQSEARTRDGHFVGYRDSLTEVPQARMWSAHSRIYVPIRRDITSSLVLIDYEAAEGLTVEQLADYATVRGVAGELPARMEGDQASILTLFEDGVDAPEGLTGYDRSYVSALYAGLPNLPAGVVAQNARDRADRPRE